MLFSKKIRKNIIAMFISMMILSTGFGFYTGDIVYGDEISDLEKKIQSGKDQLKQYDSEIQKFKDDATKNKQMQESVTKKLILSEQILSDYSNKIAELNAKVNDKKKQIDSKTTEISKKETEIANTQTEIDENLVLFAEKIRALYISGNDDYINVLMGSGDFFSMMLNYQFTENITEQNMNFMNDLKTKIETLEIDKVKLSSEKTNLDVEKANLEVDLDKISNLSSKEREQNSAYQDDVAKYGKLVNQAEYDRTLATTKKQATQQQIKDMEAMVDRLIEERSRKETQFEGGEWGWPMPGYYTITSPFGRRDFAANPNHKGNDVAGNNAQGEWINGKTIISANDGVVIAVNQYGYGGGYGTYVVVDHGGGYSTFYAHMQAGSAAVSEGQKVKRGDALGRVGSTGLSTGAHLHFETRKNKVPTEPISYYPNIKFRLAY